MFSLKKSIQLLQGYYHFLYLGKFLEYIVQHNDLSTYASNIPIRTGSRSFFIIKGTIIKTVLRSIHLQPRKRNLLGFMVEVGARRGIFSITRELLFTYNTFALFVRSILADQYLAFEQIIILIRNVLTHNTQPDICIDADSISGRKKFLKQKNIRHICFDFLYAKHIPNRKGSTQYGVSIHIDVDDIRESIPLMHVFSLHQLYLLAELCYNLCILYQKQRKFTKKS